MSTKTRKRIWPVSIAAVIGVVVMLAVLATVTLPAGTAQAQPADPGAPEAVTGLSAVPAETSVALSWTIAEEGGFPTSGHEVEQQAAGASSWTRVVDDLAADATSYEVTGLTAGTSYNFRVRAVAGMRGQFDGPWAMVDGRTTGGTMLPATGDMIKSDSSSGGGAPEFQVVIESLPTRFGGGQLHRAVPGGRLPGARNDTGQFGVLCCGESDERGDGKWRPGVHHHCAES